MENTFTVIPPKLDKLFYRTLVTSESKAVAKSTLQKSIRRGAVAMAVFYAMSLLHSNQIENLMNRLLVIASEDVGVGDNSLIVHASNLYGQYKSKRALLPKSTNWRELNNDPALRQGICKLISHACLTAKCRACDNLAIAVIVPLMEGKQVPEEIPMTQFMQKMGTALFNKDMQKVCDLIFEKSLARGAPHKEQVFRSLFYAQHERGKSTRQFVCHACLVDQISEADLAYSDLEKTVTAVPDPSQHIAAIIEGKETSPKAPLWAMDIHVRGAKSASDIRGFIESENSALLPRSPFVDVYYSHALTFGAATRWEIMCEAKREAAAKRKESKKRKADDDESN